MVKLCAIAVLLTVTISAVWCVDGCIDPMTARTSPSFAQLPDDDGSRLPCLCVLPFQAEPLGPGEPAWPLTVPDLALPLRDAPPAPSFDIDHPPRTA